LEITCSGYPYRGKAFSVGKAERRCVLAMNFGITVYQNSANLHLRFEGDFDGSSAYEVLGALEKRCRFASRAFIHTNGLKQLDPFGSSVFHAILNRLKQVGKCGLLHFTGDYAEELAPKRSKLH
jgi:anti-anti-sigma regulatory factor